MSKTLKGRKPAVEIIYHKTNFRFINDSQLQDNNAS